MRQHRKSNLLSDYIMAANDENETGVEVTGVCSKYLSKRHRNARLDREVGPVQ
jgi:sulfite reductase alpha subunit-like flavoprotein